MKKFTLHYYSYSYLLRQHKHQAGYYGTGNGTGYTLKPNYTI
jgi:hypothetical protein